MRDTFFWSTQRIFIGKGGEIIVNVIFLIFKVIYICPIINKKIKK